MFREWERLPEADDKEENKLMNTYSTSVKDFTPNPCSFAGRDKKSRHSVLVTFHMRTNLKRISLNFRRTPVTPLTSRHRERFVFLIFNVPLIKPDGSRFAP